jgi:hypothetical protein
MFPGRTELQLSIVWAMACARDLAGGGSGGTHTEEGSYHVAGISQSVRGNTIVATARPQGASRMRRLGHLVARGAHAAWAAVAGGAGL